MKINPSSLMLLAVSLPALGATVDQLPKSEPYLAAANFNRISMVRIFSRDGRPDLLQADLDNATALIKSTSQLRQFLANRNTPLDKLPQPIREDFINSLQFTGGGLGSYSYLDLRDYLSASEIYQVLSWFGAQNSISLIPDVEVKTELDQAIMNHMKSLRLGQQLSDESAVKSVQANSASTPPDGKIDYGCFIGSAGVAQCIFEAGYLCQSWCGVTTPPPV
jgi:hypothetical protein